ncbi:MAG: Stp1/IreP family PP2C-type Ser/Thr phosphatase [Nitrospirae bacterium]|nr:Stp1/IreP family PP2C-type Ser/Thr phosphatase [Nitrospirota bacterium]
MRLLKPTIEYLTNQGKVRKNNEDSVWASEIIRNGVNQLSVFIIADGMGGYEGGEIASGNAVEYVIKCVKDSKFATMLDGNKQIKSFLSETVDNINRLIYKENQIQKNKSSMGTTLTIGIQKDDEIHLANVGDSRAYLIRGQSIEQITTDHSVAWEYLDNGVISEEEARDHSRKNELTRSVGTGATVEADIYTRQIKPNDYLVFCTDGLTNMVTDKEIRDIVLKERSVKKAGAGLIELANDRGGTDNISVIVVSYSVNGSDELQAKGTVKLRPVKYKVKSRNKKWLTLGLGTASLVVLLILLWYIFFFRHF